MILDLVLEYNEDIVDLISSNTVDFKKQGAETFTIQLKLNPEAVAQRSSVKKVFLEISQNSQENNYARAFFAKFLRTPFLTKHLWWLLL